MNPIRHTRKDELLTVRKAMAGTGATVYSDVIDMSQVGGIDEMALAITHPALPNLADTKTMTMTVQSSSDGTTWADVAGASLVATGSGTSGADANEAMFRSPFSTGQYLRLKITASASAGDSTTVSAELSIRA